MQIEHLNIHEQYIEEHIEERSERIKTIASRLYAKQKITDEQISELIPMVNAVARKVISYIKPPLTIDDLVSAGMVGLVKAAKDYDPSHNAEFKTYACIRIRGAILDELKSWSFVSDNVRKKIKEAMTLSQQIEQETGVSPGDDELAEKLGISTEELYKTYENARAQQFVSMDCPTEDEYSLGSLIACANTDSPDCNLEKQELMEKLAEAIGQLDQKQRQLILLYYQQNLTMKQIAEVFSITESRVSQIHSSAIFNLSVKLSEWNNER